MLGTAITADKIAAYRAALYRVQSSGGTITLRIGVRAPQLHSIFNAAGAKCGVVITAFNPLGRQLNHAANLYAERRLRQQLRRLALRVLEAEGADPIGAWPSEPSFFAVGIGRDASRLVGTRFLQDAVVWVGVDAVPELVLLR